MDHRWMPPAPPEHGAKTILLVALVTPLTVALGTSIRVTGSALVSSLFLCGIGGFSLLFHEAVRVALDPGENGQPCVRRFLVVEGGAIAALAGGLAVTHHWVWALLILLLPGIAVVAWFTRSRENPLRTAAIGVPVLGGVVPLGLSLLGIRDVGTLLTVFGIFVMFYELAVLRVGSAVGAFSLDARLVMLPPVGAVLVAGGGAVASVFGVGVPLVFGLSALRSVNLSLRESAPSLKRLGRSEALLSLVFVLSGPVLLP